MFNMLYEHLFVCQSLLQERRRPPTGGLRETFKESFGGGFPCPHPLEWGLKRPLEPLDFGFPTGENNGYCMEWNDAHWGVSCRSLKIVGSLKGLIHRA